MDRHDRTLNAVPVAPAVVPAALDTAPVDPALLHRLLGLLGQPFLLQRRAHLASSTSQRSSSASSSSAWWSRRSCWRSWPAQ